MSGPNTSRVLRSANEIGVPVNAMKTALGSASRMWAGVAVEVVVVAAVRLVDDHDDVASVGEQRVIRTRLAFPGGETELLQGGEVDAAGGAVGEFVAQLSALGDLDGGFAQQPGPVERLIKLTVEFLAVGDDDDRRVLELGLLGHQLRVQLHLHRLARTLGVPDDAGLPVALPRPPLSTRPPW
jgi:hypothetical protein